MSPRTVRLSRQELYDQVWSEALSAVASRLGLTENGLRKVCLKHRVPLPARGYRQRLRSGKQVKPTPLPALPDEQEIVVTITPRPDDGGDGSAMFLPASEAEASLPPVVVAGELQRPHAATEALKAALKRPPDRDGFARSKVPDAFEARVHTSSISRLLRLADALAKACDKRGFTLRPGTGEPRYGGQLQVVVDGFAFGISFNERARVSAYEPTAAETERRRKGHYVYTPDKTLIPTGELSLKLDPVWGTRLQGMWTDSTKRVVEERLGEVMVGLRRLAIWRRAEREEEDLRQARFDEEQARRARLRLEVEGEQQRIA